ncbi:uncharacterized protein [Prorops nasuta]|uniref:uncharacterized protein n=1 Tax=Prorops nasuta TaxID=863751 RepID=UPI0034CEACB0
MGPGSQYGGYRGAANKKGHYFLKENGRWSGELLDAAVSMRSGGGEDRVRNVSGELLDTECSTGSELGLKLESHDAGFIAESLAGSIIGCRAHEQAESLAGYVGSLTSHGHTDLMANMLASGYCVDGDSVRWQKCDLIYPADLKRRLWSRHWLQKRNSGNGVLTMLFKELSPEDPQAFQNYIRMGEEAMERLLTQITSLICKQDTVMRQAISPRMRLGVTLRFLATGSTYQDLAFSTRIAPNTLSKLIPDTLNAIIKVLEYKVIPFPQQPDDWKVISDKFQSLWQFPLCIGALDGKHISFRPPRFEDIGKNGRLHDSSVFRQSPLGLKLRNNSLQLPEEKKLPGFNMKLPYVIIADNEFGLHVSLMKPYPESNLFPEKRIFNNRLSRARRVVENAFGILVNRFRILLNPILLSVEKVEIISYACVLLHNLLIEKSLGRQGGNHSSGEARDVRDKFIIYFNTIGAVPWQYNAITNGNV